MDCCLTGLTATDITLGSIRKNISARRAAVYTFLYDHCYNDELSDSNILSPLPQSSHATSPLLRASIDYESNTQPRDYGILVPGEQDELSFQAYGNVVNGSSEMVAAAPNRSQLRNYINGTC